MKKEGKIIVEPLGDKFSKRESDITHTTYEEETAFYSLVQAGNVEAVKTAVSEMFDKGVVVGRMSDDETRQAKYWAVCCTTLGCRYAIWGGLDELEAFGISDEYIRAIDKMQSPEEITAFMTKKVVELTEMVKNSRGKNCPKKLRTAINYIERNLHKNLSVKTLCDLTGFSEDYFSKLFAKRIGMTPKKYIIDRKLEESLLLLKSGHSSSEVSYILSFGSQSHFISLFKRKYAKTPREFLESQ